MKPVNPSEYSPRRPPLASIDRVAERTQRRSPDSSVSFATPSRVLEPSPSPLPPVRTTNKRASIAVSVAPTSPEVPKPLTPYEDKVIPTLRNRHRGDAAAVVHSSGTASTKTSKEDAENDDAIAELNQAEMIEANQMMNVFDKQLVGEYCSTSLPHSLVLQIGKLYHRNHVQREEALEEIYQILSRFAGEPEDARAFLRAGSFVVARMFRVDVLAIFCHSLKLFHLLMNDYVRRHAIQRQDIIASLERVLPVLLQRTGDSNARLRLKAQEAIIESASYRELKPLQVIPHHCVYPFPKTCAPRLAISRCELIDELMKILDVKKGDNGLNVDNVSKFCAQAVEHNGSSLRRRILPTEFVLSLLAGEVRELAIKILLSLYKVREIDRT